MKYWYRKINQNTVAGLTTHVVNPLDWRSRVQEEITRHNNSTLCGYCRDIVHCMVYGISMTSPQRVHGRDIADLLLHLQYLSPPSPLPYLLLVMMFDNFCAYFSTRVGVRMFSYCLVEFLILKLTAWCFKLHILALNTESVSGLGRGWKRFRDLRPIVSYHSLDNGYTSIHTYVRNDIETGVRGQSISMLDSSLKTSTLHRL